MDKKQLQQLNRLGKKALTVELKKQDAQALEQDTWKCAENLVKICAGAACMDTFLRASVSDHRYETLFQDRKWLLLFLHKDLPERLEKFLPGGLHYLRCQNILQD